MSINLLILVMEVNLRVVRYLYLLIRMLLIRRMKLKVRRRMYGMMWELRGVINGNVQLFVRSYTLYGHVRLCMWVDLRVNRLVRISVLRYRRIEGYVCVGQLVLVLNVDVRLRL